MRSFDKDKSPAVEEKFQLRARRDGLQMIQIFFSARRPVANANGRDWSPSDPEDFTVACAMQGVPRVGEEIIPRDGSTIYVVHKVAYSVEVIDGMCAAGANVFCHKRWDLADPKD